MKKNPLTVILFGILLVIISLALSSCGQESPPSSVEVDTGESEEIDFSELDTGAAIRAVDLLEAWVIAGAPDNEPFDYVGVDGNIYHALYEIDIHPLFAKNDIWFEDSQACSGCHFGNLESSYHEMDLGTYEGIMKGGDTISEAPGVPILGQSEIGSNDYDWDHSKLRERLRNNRMPPGWPFDITETNRDGPCVEVSSGGVMVVTGEDGNLQYGCDLNAIGVLSS